MTFPKCHWDLLPAETVPEKINLPLGLDCPLEAFLFLVTTKGASGWCSGALISDKKKKTLKTTRMEIIYTMSTYHGFKHLGSFPHCNSTLPRMFLLHEITCQTERLLMSSLWKGSVHYHPGYVWASPFITRGWCYSVHRAEEIRFGHTFMQCQGNCVSPWPTHPCLCCGV